MKNKKFFKSSLLLTLLITVSTFMFSCSEEVVLTSSVNENEYQTVNDVYGSIRNTDDSRSSALFEVRSAGITTDFIIKLTKGFNQAIDARMLLDDKLVAEYNKLHNTKFAMYPSALVTFEEDGVILIAPGDRESVSVTVKIKSNSSLVSGTTYVLPISASVSTGGTKLNNLSNVILLRYLGDMPDCSKTPDIKVISCIETNDTNPLNNLELTLKKSKKLLFDMVVLFAANTHYDSENGRVYLSLNRETKALLQEREKFLKPLQDRGMKVILGIMGDHDISGVANMSTFMAREFAAELKSFCDTYKLDGVFYDDEYSKSPEIPAPGFVRPSYAAASRLVYETKMAMPDKLCMVYIYHLTSQLSSVDGVEPGRYVDYALADYGDEVNLNSYPGITKRQMAPLSQEFAKDLIMSHEDLTRVAKDGYGAHMIFAMNPKRSNWTFIQMSGLGAVAKGFFQDEVVWTKKVYEVGEGMAK